MALIPPDRDQVEIGLASARTVARAADHHISASLPEPAAPLVVAQFIPQPPVHEEGLRVERGDERREDVRSEQ
jgi:hypothetical protein